MDELKYRSMENAGGVT